MYTSGTWASNGYSHATPARVGRGGCFQSEHRRVPPRWRTFKAAALCPSRAGPRGSLAQRVEGNCVVCASQIVRICCTPKVDGNMPCSSCLANFSLFERVSHGMCLAKSLGTAFAPRVRLGRLSASRCSFFLQKSVRATITCPLPHAHNPPTSHSALTPALTCPVAYAHATLPPLTLPSHPP